MFAFLAGRHFELLTLVPCPNSEADVAQALDKCFRLANRVFSLRDGDQLVPRRFRSTIPRFVQIRHATRSSDGNLHQFDGPASRLMRRSPDLFEHFSSRKFFLVGVGDGGTAELLNHKSHQRTSAGQRGPAKRRPAFTPVATGKGYRAPARRIATRSGPPRV